MEQKIIVKKTYNLIAEKYQQRYRKISPLFKKNSKYFINLLPKKALILDLGCGPGRDAKFFTKIGYKVIGVDFSKGMLKIAKKVAPQAKFIQKDFIKLGFKENSFDGIWMSFSLLHLPKKETPALLKKLYYILKPKGILFIATKEGKRDIIEKENLDGDLLMYESFWQKEDLEKLIKKSGFKILKLSIGYDRYESDEKIIIIFGQKL